MKKYKIRKHKLKRIDRKTGRVKKEERVLEEIKRKEPEFSLLGKEVYKTYKFWRPIRIDAEITQEIKNVRLWLKKRKKDLEKKGYYWALANGKLKEWEKKHGEVM